MRLLQASNERRFTSGGATTGSARERRGAALARPLRAGTLRFSSSDSAAAPKQDEKSPAREEAEGYAGSFFVFGHGGCFGELGHCDVSDAPRAVFDRRLPHPLNPWFKTVVVTAALRRVMRLSDKETFKVTVVAVVPENQFSRVKREDPLRFESVSLIAYQDPSAAGIPLPQEQQPSQ